MLSAPRRCRKAAALALVAGVAALCVVWPVPPVAAAPAQTTPALAPPPPTVLPGLEVLTVATGLVAGAGAAAGATTGTAAGLTACGTATAGACFIAAAVGAGAFIGTTKVLELSSWYDYDEASQLSNGGISSGFQRCDSRTGAGWAYGSSIQGSGATCVALSYGAQPAFEAGNAWYLRAPLVEPYWFPTTWDPIHYDGTNADGLSVRSLNPTDRYVRWSPDLVGDVAQSGTLVLSRPASDTLACMGYVACGVHPEDTFDIGITNSITTWTGHTNLAEVPVDPRVTVHGMQRQVVATADCYNPDTDGHDLVEQITGWYFDSETERFPIKLPTCTGTAFPLMHRLTLNLFTLGEGLTETLFDVRIPESLLTQTDFEICLTTTCEPEVQTETETEPERCTIASVTVPMAWCDGREQVETDFDVRMPEMEPPYDPREPPAPEPPEVGEEEPDPPEDDQPRDPTTDESECMPSGWSLFNPIEWVLRPVKCALKWAFMPSTPVPEALTELRTEYEASTPGEVRTAVEEVQTAWTTAVDGPGGSGGCAGPAIAFTFSGVQYGPYYPLSACDEPVRSIAEFFNGFVMAMVLATTLVMAYNRIVQPFGIEPIVTRPVDTDEHGKPFARRWFGW